MARNQILQFPVGIGHRLTSGIGHPTTAPTATAAATTPGTDPQTRHTHDRRSSDILTRNEAASVDHSGG